jgi:phosphotriesterase-related protein
LEAIRTINGTISPDDLGFTLMHEHVMVSTSGLWDQYPDLLGPDRAARAVASLKKAKAESIATMVDATTFDLGRKAELLSRVSKTLGLTLLMQRDGRPLSRPDRCVI